MAPSEVKVNTIDPASNTTTWGCHNCSFFVQMKEQKREESKIGNCHVNAPVLSDESKIGRFPIVISSMWCGQYQEQK